MENHHPQQVSAGAGSGAVAKSTGSLVGGDADQALQRSQRSSGSERTAYPDGFIERRNGSGKVGSVGRRAAEVQPGRASGCLAGLANGGSDSDPETGVEATGDAGRAD